MAATVGSAAPFRETASQEHEELKAVLTRYEDDPAIKDLLISFGGVRPATQMKRLWKSRRHSIPSKLLGTLLQPMSNLMGTLTRGDQYDPWGNTVVLYNRDPAFLEHELGHAKDWARRRTPGAYAAARGIPFAGTPVALYQETVASRNALRGLVTDALKDNKLTRDEAKSIARANRVLGGGWGSYAGSLPFIEASRVLPPLGVLATPAALLGGLIGQGVGAAAKPFIPPEQREAYRRVLAELKDEERALRRNRSKEPELSPVLVPA